MSKSLPKGHDSCLGKTFRYTPSVHTDLAQTFARIRQQRQALPKPEDAGNVLALPARKKG
jgi:hypothetical protein